MDKDKLEQIISANKEAFNNQQPSPKVWSNILKSFDSGKSVSWWKIAAVVFFCTSSFFAYQNYFIPKQSTAELTEIESYYISQINYKKALVQNLHQDEEARAVIEQDLLKLDAMYEVLKEEWKKKPSRQVLEAMTLNLLVRLDLLNRQLQENAEETVEPRSI